jgi:hypothetical protein
MSYFQKMMQTDTAKDVEQVVSSGSSYFGKLMSSMKPAPKQEPTMPTSRGGARNQGPFQFKRGDVRGNLQQILNKAESPDYITLAGGKKVKELRNMTVAEIGKQFGNKAAGRYQIQRNTAFDALRGAGLDPNTFKFDEKGQDKIFELLLERRGYSDYKAGRLSKEEFAARLSMEWAGLPKNRTGKSFHAGGGNNKAHVAWDDVLRALD